MGFIYIRLACMVSFAETLKAKYLDIQMIAGLKNIDVFIYSVVKT